MSNHDWYELTEGLSLLQGDILMKFTRYSCRVGLPHYAKAFEQEIAVAQVSPGPGTFRAGADCGESVAVAFGGQVSDC